MIAKFREVQRAVAHLRASLDGFSENGKAALGYYPDGVTRSRGLSVTAVQLGPALDVMCRRFPEAIAATVAIKGRDGPVGAIQCRCSHDIQKVCDRHCQHHRNRPMVNVLVCPSGTPPSDEDWENALGAIQESIHLYLLDENTLRDRQHHHRSRHHGIIGKTKL